MSDEAVLHYQPDLTRRRLALAATAAGGLAAGGAAVPFVLSLAPSERARLALADCRGDP